VALLAALVALRQADPRWQQLELRAVHVHHGLRPAADSWASHCRRLCRQLGVPLSVRRIRIGPARGESLEAAARSARYAALARGLRRADWLLAAHHVDDQLETLLLQLLRGAGVAGLAAMPRQAPFAGGWLVRPLLGESRSALEDWLRARQLAWVEDDSNVDERFDRNYLRRRVLPLLRARWPAAATVAARSAAHLGEARELLDTLAAADLAVVGVEERLIDLSALATLAAARQRNVLRYWLQRRGLGLPDTRHLERIRCELPAARADAQPRVRWPGGEVRRFRGRLYAFRPPAAAAEPTAAAPRSRTAATPVRQATPERRPWRWRGGRRFDLDAGRGTLRLLADPHGEFDAGSLPPTLWVGGREGGEGLVTQVGGPRRALKELLRTAAIPPWERTGLPVLFATSAQDGGGVIAVAGVCMATAYRAIPGKTASRHRLRLVWESDFC
jgi:tRNA(Ile)-lysidine synthase